MTTATTTAARRSRNPWNALIWPVLIFMGLLFVYPLVSILLTSLAEGGIENYRTALTDPIYTRALGTTFLTALIVTVTAIVLAYPYAYLMHAASPRLRGVLVFLVLLPFFTSLLVRTYAWTVWLQETGIINDALLGIGVIDAPLPLMRNTLGVTIGMVHSLLPFAVLPIYSSMARVDPALVPAARSLGARAGEAFRDVFLPLTVPGIVSGGLIVFVMSLGYYITPALLGSPQNAMLSELIAGLIQEQLNLGLGAALGMVLLVLTLLILVIGTRVVRLRDIVGGGR